MPAAAPSPSAATAISVRDVPDVARQADDVRLVREDRAGDVVGRRVRGELGDRDGVDAEALPLDELGLEVQSASGMKRGLA